MFEGGAEFLGEPAMSNKNKADHRYSSNFTPGSAERPRMCRERPHMQYAIQSPPDHRRAR